MNMIEVRRLGVSCKEKKKGRLCYPVSKMLAGGYLNRHKIPHLELLSEERDLCPFSHALDLLGTLATYADIFGSGKK